MKNWEPFVCFPLFAIDKRKALSCFKIKFSSVSKKETKERQINLPLAFRPFTSISHEELPRWAVKTQKQSMPLIRKTVCTQAIVEQPLIKKIWKFQLLQATLPFLNRFCEISGCSSNIAEISPALLLKQISFSCRMGRSHAAPWN